MLQKSANNEWVQPVCSTPNFLCILVLCWCYPVTTIHSKKFMKYFGHIAGIWQPAFFSSTWYNFIIFTESHCFLPILDCFLQQLRRHGDIIKRTVGGFLVVQGRADDTMNLGGIKVISLFSFSFLCLSL